jgi:hypothetical protein
MLHQGGAGFDPVAVVAIKDPFHRPHFSGMDMTTNHTVHVAAAGLIGKSLLIISDELDGVLDPVLQVSGN